MRNYNFFDTEHKVLRFVAQRGRGCNSSHACLIIVVSIPWSQFEFDHIWDVIWLRARGNIARTALYIVYLCIVAQSFEQLTGFVYQIWLHLTGFTQCPYITLCVLDYFLVLYLHACCISATWWGEPG